MAAAPSGAGGGGAEEELEECAICMEEIAVNTMLPCSCKVSYCLRCWDRALAVSFNTCGLARCPTCRSQVRVDYDAGAGRLVFSTEEPLPDLDAKCPLDDAQAQQEQRTRAAKALQARYTETIQRLLEQAMPAQVTRLRDFGAARPYLQELARRPEERLREMPEEDFARCLEAALSRESENGVAEDLPPAERLIAALGHPGRVPSLVASVLEPPPTCVCGDNLRMCVGGQRIRKATEQRFPGAAAEDIDRVYRKIVEDNIPFVVCDLCNSPISASGAVWTCETSNATILHATSYDVCDVCFMRYACAWEVEPSVSRPSGSDDPPVGEEEAPATA